MIGNIVWLFPLLCSTGSAVEMTGPSTYTAKVGSISHIPCTFTADRLPADLKYFAVFWHLEGNRILTYDNNVTSTDPRYSLDEDRALHGIADLTISNTFASDGGVYTCSVLSSPFDMKKEIRVDISGAALEMTGPSTYTAKVESISHIPCTFTADTLPADPRYFAVFWYLKEKNLLSYENTVTSTDPRYSLDEDRALYGIADLTISNPSVSDGGVYTCSVSYSRSLMEKEIRVNISARPLLSILSKSVQRDTENNLTCMANGFFPLDIVITWHRDGEILKDQLMGESHRNDNGTYQVSSTVTITSTDDDQNKTFSCRVQHVSLQELLQEDFQLVYQEPSHVVIICVVIAVVVLVTIAVVSILWWKLKPCRKAHERPQKSSGDSSLTFLEELSRHQAGEKTQSFGNEETVELLSLNRGHLPDPKMGNIRVPKLTEGTRGTLECRISNYVPGKHRAIWSIKEKSSDQFIEVDSTCKIPDIKKVKSSDTSIATLTLFPVQKSDDGSVFRCSMEIPGSDRVIEKRKGPVFVEENPQRSLTW